MPDFVRTRPGRGKPMKLRSWISEWIVTNGLGGYASGTIAGIVTRRLSRHVDRGAPFPVRPVDDAEST